LFDQHHHGLWQSDRLAWQADTQPITYFLADSGTGNVIDSNFIPNSRSGHQSYPARLGAFNSEKARLNFSATTLQARGTMVGQMAAIG